jgi:hypothetical protein
VSPLVNRLFNRQVYHPVSRLLNQHQIQQRNHRADQRHSQPTDQARNQRSFHQLNLLVVQLRSLHHGRHVNQHVNLLCSLLRYLRDNRPLNRVHNLYRGQPPNLPATQPCNRHVDLLHNQHVDRQLSRHVYQLANPLTTQAHSLLSVQVASHLIVPVNSQRADPRPSRLLRHLRRHRCSQPRGRALGQLVSRLRCPLPNRVHSLLPTLPRSPARGRLRSHLLGPRVNRPPSRRHRHRCPHNSPRVRLLLSPRLSPSLRRARSLLRPRPHSQAVDLQPNRRLYPPRSRHHYLLRSLACSRPTYRRRNRLRDPLNNLPTGPQRSPQAGHPHSRLAALQHSLRTVHQPSPAYCLPYSRRPNRRHARARSPPVSRPPSPALSRHLYLRCNHQNSRR